MVEFGIHLTSIPDSEAGQSPRDLLEQHRRWLHEGEDFMSTPLGPTPEDAIAQLTPMVELGVAEVILGFEDFPTLELFVDRVVPAFR